MERHEEEVIQHVKELERIYERKLAITTNKLITSEEIAFRNNLVSRENLTDLEVKHSQGIQ